LLVLLSIALGATTSAAQLRPLEPIPIDIFRPASVLHLAAGVGVFADQRASLAGTSGTLRELGNLSAAWRSGRFALEANGTVRRSFHDRDRFAEPHRTVTETGPRRSDSGDFSIGTLVRITPERFPAPLALRFGTRLPNSDDQVGIDRDRMDFYATLGGQLRRAGFSLTGEAGLGIFGTHDLEFEQTDPLLYSLTAEQRLGAAGVSASFLGHRAGFGGWVQRGSESRSELRMGASLGSRYRVSAQYVHGLAQFSPGSGWLVSVATRR
jgi:hypothetical protein